MFPLRRASPRPVSATALYSHKKSEVTPSTSGLSEEGLGDKRPEPPAGSGWTSETATQTLDSPTRAIRG